MKTLTMSELQSTRKKNDDLLLVNVLPEDAFRKKHIPDSKNVPVEDGDFVGRMVDLASGKDQQVVVYCANEKCDASPRAAKKLEQAGFQNVYDFEGGVESWENAGLPLVASA